MFDVNGKCVLMHQTLQPKLSAMSGSFISEDSLGKVLSIIKRTDFVLSYLFIPCINDYYSIVYSVDSELASGCYIWCCGPGQVAHIRPRIHLFELLLSLFYVLCLRVHTGSLNKDQSVYQLL